MKNSDKNNKILVLGSAGQIGKPLVDYLSIVGYEVITFDIKDSLTQDIRIANNFALTNAMLESDFVVFLAFDVGGSKYLQQKQGTLETLSNNTEIMRNVFNKLESTSKPFIFISSQLANNINSPYGIQKRLGEFYTAALNGLSVRLWNVYGPEHDLQKSHAITDFILKARDSQFIDLRTDGREKRQFIHAIDFARAIVSLIEKFDSLDKTKQYHITSFKWLSIRDVAEIIALKMNAHVIPGINKDSIHTEVLYQPDSYIQNYWKPSIEIEEGIQSMIEYYTNGDGKNVRF